MFVILSFCVCVCVCMMSCLTRTCWAGRWLPAWRRRSASIAGTRSSISRRKRKTTPRREMHRTTSGRVRSSATLRRSVETGCWSYSSQWTHTHTHTLRAIFANLNFINIIGRWKNRFIAPWQHAMAVIFMVWIQFNACAYTLRDILELTCFLQCLKNGVCAVFVVIRGNE